MRVLAGTVAPAALIAVLRLLKSRSWGTHYDVTEEVTVIVERDADGGTMDVVGVRLWGEFAARKSFQSSTRRASDRQERTLEKLGSGGCTGW